MSREKQIDDKNCNGCLHFEACCKWTDFPKQIGFPVCRKFTPTNTPTCTNLHQSYTNLTPTSTNSELEQIEEIYEVLTRDCDTSCVECKFDRLDLCVAHHKAEALYEAGYRKQSENVVELPCKVGDVLYVISQMKDKRILPFINEYEVTSIDIKRKSIVIYHEMDGYIKSFKQTDFGRTIFLTKEEAERVVTDINVGGK